MKRHTETKNYDMTGSSGINITDSISLTFNSRYRVNSRLLLIITALAGLTGFTFSFLSLFSFDCDRKMLYAAEGIVFAVSSILCMFPSKARNLNLLLYLAWGYGTYRKITEFALGYGLFVNVIAEKLRLVGNGHTVYRIPEGTDAPYCLTLFLIFLFTAIIPVLCYNTIVKPRFIVIFICTFPFIETGLMFGFSPDHIAFSLLISYWIAVFAMRIAGNQYHTESGKPVFVRKKNMFVSSGNLRNNVIEDIGIITLISVFTFFLISSWMINVLKVERPEKVNQTRTEIKTSLSDFTLEKIANNVHDDTERNPVTDRSQLGNLSRVTFADKTDLTVMTSDKIPGLLYLRGFVGSDYTQNTWYSLSSYPNEETKALFERFKAEDDFPQYYNFRNDSVLNSIAPGKYRKTHIIVNSWFKVNKYAFTPYSMSKNPQLVPEKDGSLNVKDINSYSFDSYVPDRMFSDTDFIAAHRSELPLYGSETEKAYRDYIYSNYTLLPESEKMNELAADYGYIPDYNGSNINDIVFAIRKILNESAEYTLEPGITPADTELTWYLLKENHKGYCSHFATAAVVLARLNGVPARYAEGYVIVPSDFEKAHVVESFYKIDVHDSRAHAWAEFYIDGYGWLPFEFTPGYDRGIVSAETKRIPPPEEMTEPAATEPAVTVTEPVATEIVTELVPAAPAETEAVTEITDKQAESSPSGQDGSPDTKFSEFIAVTLTFLFSVLAAVFIIAMLIILRHAAVINHRNRSFRTESNSKNLISVYRYVLDLLDHVSIRKGNMLPMDFAEFAEEQAGDLVEKGSLAKLVSLSLKAGFSSEEITNDELASAVKTANALADKIMEGKTGKEKFIFRFILNLRR